MRFDDSQWPLLVVSVSGAPSDEEFEEYLASYDAFLGRGQKYAIIYETRPDAPMFSVGHARKQAKWIAEHDEEIRRLCVGIAFVLPAPVLRGVLRFILGIQDIPAPYKVFRDMAEATPWLDDRMAIEGLRPKVQPA